MVTPTLPQEVTRALLIAHLKAEVYLGNPEAYEGIATMHSNEPEL